MKKAQEIKVMLQPGVHVAKTRRWFAMMLLQGLLFGLLVRVVIYQNPSIWDGLFIAICAACLFGLYRSSFGKSTEFTLAIGQEGLFLTDKEGKTIQHITAGDIGELRADFRDYNPMAGSLKEILMTLAGKPDPDRLIVKLEGDEKVFFLIPASEHERHKIKEYADMLP